jgi:endonuclease/exonuclease/phosphatase (EEP) superfamily protein YafD
VVHPFPPLGRRSARDWRGELLDLPAAPAGPAVIAGDFNATLDHQAFRSVLERGWQDAGAGLGEGLHATWPVERRVLGLAIDHVLVSPALSVRGVSLHEVDGTDHRAVIARLDHAPS